MRGIIENRERRSYFLQIFSVLILFLTGLGLPSFADAQGVLEIPQHNSFQSGISNLSGWKCKVGQLTARFNGWDPIPLAYGSPRLDTQAVCGHSNTGFVLLINWNELGNGRHSVQVFDDGVEFARASFTVVTPGAAFLRKAAAVVTVRDFPQTGDVTTLRWQESTQSFVIVSRRTADVRNIEGRYAYTGALTADTCSFPPFAFELQTTFRVKQEGTTLTATTPFSGGLQLSGQIEPDDVVTILSQPVLDAPQAGCTRRRTLTLEGDGQGNNITAAIAYEFFGSCSDTDCRQLFSGVWKEEK